MTFRIKIQEVTFEQVRTGKGKPYDKAEVNYLFQGNARTQKIMSFANPGVFPKLREMKAGEEYDVEVTKDDKGYNSWASVTKATDSEPVKQAVGTPGSATGRTNVSTYETAEERKIKQMYIIKQSSIANAIEYHTGGEATIEDILSTAQTFVDFVYGNEQEKSLTEMDNDIPE